MMTYVISCGFPEEHSSLTHSTLGTINPALRLLNRGGPSDVLEFDFHELRVTRVQSLKCIGVYLGSVLAPKVCCPMSAVKYNRTDESVFFLGGVGVGIMNPKDDKNTDITQDMVAGDKSRLSRTFSDPSGGRTPLHRHTVSEVETGTGTWAGTVEDTRGGKSKSQRTEREVSYSNIGTHSDKKRCRESTKDTADNGQANAVSLSALIAQRFTMELSGLWTPLQQLMAKFWSKVLHHNRGKSEFR